MTMSYKRISYIYRAARILAVCLTALSAISCDKKGEVYPSMITKFGDIRTNADGVLTDMTIDNGETFLITNTNIKPHRPDTSYRAIIGYVTKSNGTCKEAYIHSLTGAITLADSSAQALHHPTGIESMWMEGKYINMQLSAKSQGGRHYWGYCIDRIEQSGENNRQYAHHHLSIHHNQGNDPLSYTETYYCSILLPSLPDFKQGDTISICVNTFKGMKTWKFNTIH